MKKLFFILLLVPFLSFGQTGASFYGLISKPYIGAGFRSHIQDNFWGDFKFVSTSSQKYWYSIPRVKLNFTLRVDKVFATGDNNRIGFFGGIGLDFHGSFKIKHPIKVQKYYPLIAIGMKFSPFKVPIGFIFVTEYNFRYDPRIFPGIIAYF